MATSSDPCRPVPFESGCQTGALHLTTPQIAGFGATSSPAYVTRVSEDLELRNEARKEAMK